MLVIDESTSALDSVTEIKGMESIKDEKNTIISIAHRLNSIKDYEHVIIIVKGNDVESGATKSIWLSRMNIIKQF